MHNGGMRCARSDEIDEIYDNEMKSSILGVVGGENCYNEMGRDARG